MSLKTGDLVNIKGDKNEVMSVMGFLEFLNQREADTIANPVKRDWVLCVFLNDKLKKATFHKDQLELYPSEIDGGSPDSFK